MKTITTGSDFSGVGAFDYAIERIAEKKGFHHKRIYACDLDKYARITYAHNHGEPDYYPKDVYEREIPEESLDVYMTSPPCQAFSLAGKRKGKDDERGILFFNSHEFIKKNKPRFFIFENVKGLLSDDNGRTFQEWINMLGGKSVNGLPILFPHDEAVEYHLYWKVLNSKHHGIPQNRERVFLVGIRDDKDNYFRFPKEEHLQKRLKDVLQDEVDPKYFLSQKMIDCLINHKSDKFEINTPVINETDQARTLRAEMGKMGRQDNFIKIKSATLKGYEEATENDSINFSVPNSETRRGRVGKGVGQTLDTSCNQDVMIMGYTRDEKGKVVKRHIKEQAGTIHTSTGSGGNTDQFVLKCIPVIASERGEKKQNGRRFKDDGDEMFTTTTQDRHGIFDGYSIRRLTPRECFRLMDFPDEFDFSVVSDSQAYKQAGNSIVVRVLEKIINNLPL